MGGWAGTAGIAWLGKLSAHQLELPGAFLRLQSAATRRLWAPRGGARSCCVPPVLDPPTQSKALPSSGCRQPARLLAQPPGSPLTPSPQLVPGGASEAHGHLSPSRGAGWASAGSALVPTGLLPVLPLGTLDTTGSTWAPQSAFLALIFLLEKQTQGAFCHPAPGTPTQTTPALGCPSPFIAAAACSAPGAVGPGPGPPSCPAVRGLFRCGGAGWAAAASVPG